jgi:MoaA/NifB/PqqE/SkfB family radical SAM enzyme
MPFIHQNIKQEGKVSACWRYPDRIGDYRHQSLEEIWNSDETRELRRALLNDERPVGCRSCWDFENSGVESTRQKCNETYQKKYFIDYDDVLDSMHSDYRLPYRPQSIEIRFDNTCNLRCRHCSPAYSSQWEVMAFKDPEIKELFKIHGAGRLEKKHISLPSERFEDFKKAIPYLKEVLIAGGEALQQKRHWEMIEFMRPYAENITLNYSSNLTDLGIGTWTVLEEWPRFKKIILRVSLDGDENIYSYFRTGGDLDKVKQNIEKVAQLANVDMSLTITVSVYNITRLVDCVKFVNSLGGFFHTSLVQYPKPINPKVLPEDVKQQITQTWQCFLDNINDKENWLHPRWNNQRAREEQIKRIQSYGTSVIKYMNSEDYTDALVQTKDYINKLDRVNGGSFVEVYPELSALVR